VSSCPFRKWLGLIVQPRTFSSLPGRGRGRDRDCGTSCCRRALAQLETLAVSMEQAGAPASKAGVAVFKRRAGSGYETPRSIVMTERAWSWLCGGTGGGPTGATAPTGDDDPMPALDRPTIARPTLARVSKTVRTLKQTSAIVLRPELVRALRQQTGCSRAGAYRAVAAAFAADVISGR
jgi:hypothetical protein